jgi:hypothetical protein
MGSSIPGVKLRLLIKSNCCVSNNTTDEEECQPEESMPDLDLPP